MLTDTKARAARPAEKAYKLTDRGLHMSPTGARSWRFDYRLHGKRETRTIGRFPDVSLGAARDALSRARALVPRA